MSQPFVGEIRMFGGSFPPVGWAFCHGQLIPISENETLFQLIGTTYGGDGQATFALPDLRGRLPIHQGSASSGTTYQIGEVAGSESVTLNTNQIPTHTHAATVATTGNTTSPGNAIWANVTNGARYRAHPPADPDPPDDVSMTSPSASGGSQPHENRMPTVTITFIISLFGIFPSPT